MAIFGKLIVIGAGVLYWAVVMLRSKGGNSGMKTFQYSIVYLMVLFAVMLVDHYFITTVTYIPQLKGLNHERYSTSGNSTNSHNYCVHYYAGDRGFCMDDEPAGDHE